MIFSLLLKDFAPLGTTPAHENEIFFFAFVDELDYFQCFPKGFRENPKKFLKMFEFGLGPRFDFDYA